MPTDYTDEHLNAQLAKPGWQRNDASGATQTGTLKDMATAAHADRGNHPGTIKEIETAVELELIQLQKLWEYLGLPN